ncbi:MAG: DUF924 domain-containing protein [Proteobacteria bacterium]|nr:DUF924 domain-containing protein [Pseudomonadota bacterium]
MRDPLPADAQAVIDVWFGDAESVNPEWFRKDAVFDVSIRTRFGAVLRAALAGELADWERTPPGALARIVVLDQFTRHAYRHTPRAFAGDAQALAAAKALVAGGRDRKLKPLQRCFAYLPFEHSEDAADQAESLRLFGALAAQHPAQADWLDSARRHQAVIARFGRYPHRNAVLGRDSTAEELAFLEEPGSRF